MSADVKFCGNCGARLRPGSRFCVECGETVTAFVSTVAQPAAPVPLEQQETVAVSPAAAPAWPGGTPGGTPGGPVAPPFRQPGRKPVWLLPVLIVAGIVALGAAGFGAYTFLLADDGPSMEATMAENATPDFQPVNPTTKFNPNSEAFHLTFRVKGAEAGSEIRSVWIAVNLGDAAPPNSKIDEATIMLAGNDERGSFRLRRGRAPWPVGDYKVELFVDGELIETLPFSVAR